LVSLSFRSFSPTRTAPALLALVLVALVSLPAAAQARYGQRTLRAGMHGKDVSQLQGYLDAAGYTTITNGRFDRRTAASVRAFKADNGLRATGIVDRRTARSIKHVATAPPLTGGVSYQQQTASTPKDVPTVAGTRARVLASGLAAAPRNAPFEVKAIIAEGNKIAHLPYKWGGGHGSWTDTGYDCSGSLTFALRTTFRRGPVPTFGYSNWQLPGKGAWVTTYASSYHVYMVVAGIRFDTSGLRQSGSRWQTEMRSGDGFVARHPAGF